MALKGQSHITDAQIDSLVVERNQARRTCNLTRAGQNRKELADHGILLEESKDGAQWKMK